MGEPDAARGAAGLAAMLRWARTAGLAADAGEERRLAAMRLEVLAVGALPRADAADVALTIGWAAFICCVDDLIDRRGLGLRPGEVEEFTAELRAVLAGGGGPRPATGSAHAVALKELWERTAAGMPAAWRERFIADYTDFLATEEKVSLRRGAVRLSLEDYVRLRRRTITLLPLLDVLERTGHAPMVSIAGREQAGGRLRELRWALADVAGWQTTWPRGATTRPQARTTW